MIQSSDLVNRVNRASPFRLCLGRFVIWFSDPHLRTFYGHLPLPRSGLPDLGDANRGNRPISLWPLPCSAGRLLCFSEFRQPEAALACALVAGRLLRPARTVSFVRPPPLLSFAAHRLLACDLHHWTRQSSASTGRSPAACAVHSSSLSCPRDRPRGIDIAAVSTPPARPLRASFCSRLALRVRPATPPGASEPTIGGPSGGAAHAPPFPATRRRGACRRARP